MGKVKRKSKLSSLRAKSYPIVASSVKEVDVLSIGDQLLSEIQSKLMSGKPSERHLAADMIANSMANFDDYSDQQLSHLFRILSPICVDRVENCRNSAIECLCYLSTISEKMCDLMVGSDVMTPLMAVFDKYSAIDWSKGHKCGLISRIYINSCRLLTNLCGTSDKALKVFNNSKIIHILINGLKAFDLNFEIAVSSAQCLSVVSEENQIRELLIPENIELIKNLMQKPLKNISDIHLNNLMGFIAINVGFGSQPETQELIFKLIEQTLSSDIDLKTFSELIQQFVDNQLNNDLLNEKYFELKNILLAKCVALELITNITASEDDYEDMDVETMADSEEDIGDRNHMTEGEDSHTKFSSQIEQIILDKCLVQKIGEHLGSTDPKLRQTLIKHTFGAEILNCIQSIRLCSLICVHNLIESISSQKLQINEEIWKQVYNIVFDCNTNTTGHQLVEESTNTMRAMITRNTTFRLTVDELQRLCAYCEKFDSIPIKINAINLMSVLTQRSNDLTFIENITVLLMTGLQNETHLVIRAELFDALIDIFSEDNKTDSIALKLDLINRMKVFGIIFINEAKKSQELKSNAIISTVTLNLMPFIEYKQKMLNKMLK